MLVSFWRPFGRGLEDQIEPQEHQKTVPGDTYKTRLKKILFFGSLWGVQKCTKSVPGMVEMMTWAHLDVSRRPQWHQKPPRGAEGGFRRSIFISFHQFGRHGGGKAAGNGIRISRCLPGLLCLLGLLRLFRLLGLLSVLCLASVACFAFWLAWLA